MFNKSNVAVHRPTIIFLLPRQIATVQQNNQNKITSNNRKIIHKNNHISQPQNQSQKWSRQIITTINPHNRSINNTLKTKHNKQTRKLSLQSIVKSITQTITTNNPHSLNQKHTQNKLL